MALPSGVRAVRSRAFWWFQLVCLSVFVVFAMVLTISLAGIGEEAGALKVARRFEAARHDLDWDELWRLSSSELRAWLDPETLDFEQVDGWAIPSSFDPHRLQHFNNRELFFLRAVRHHEDFHRADPADLLDDPLEYLRDLFATTDCESRAAVVSIDEASAYVLIGTDGYWRVGMFEGIGLGLVRERGAWRVSRVEAPPYPSTWRKLSLHLPLVAVRPDEVDAVIELGVDFEMEEDLRRLASFLGKRHPSATDRTAILLHPHPDLPFATVFELVGVTIRAGATQVLFTRPWFDAPPSGLQVNGVRIGVVPEVKPLPPAAGHPALSHVMTIVPDE